MKDSASNPISETEASNAVLMDDWTPTPGHVSILANFKDWSNYVNANPERALECIKEELRHVQGGESFIQPRLKYAMEARAKVPSYYRDYSQVLDSIAAFHKFFPVNEIKWEGIQLWPALRFFLYWMLDLKIINRWNPENGYHIICSPNWRKSWLAQCQASEIDDYAIDEKPDYLVFSHLRSKSWVKRNNRIYDRLMDPVIDRLKPYGSVKKIVFVVGDGPLEKNFTHPPVFLLHSYKYIKNNYLDIELFDNFCSFAEKYFSSYDVKRKDFQNYIDVFFNQYHSYYTLFKKAEPRAIFATPIDYLIPLFMAARRLGIECIDVQHGNMPGYNLPYNRWEEMPEKGYKIWPSSILVWSRREKQHVLNTFNGVIKPVVFGYPHLVMEKNSSSSNALQELEVFCQKHPFRVLVSLSEQLSLPPIIQECAADPRAREYGIGFVIKRNPKQRAVEIPENLENVFSSDKLDRSAFFSLTEGAHLHLTESSACLYEADYAGLHTMLFGSGWKLHFKDMADSGRIKVIKTANDFFRNFKLLVNSCPWPRLIDNNSNEFAEFMNSLSAN